MEIQKLEFCRFGMAVSVGGKNIMSAGSKDYDILKNGMEFCIISKRNPQHRTFVGLTNVPEWRIEIDESSTDTAQKPKTSKADSKRASL
jgi:hypothetical protein